MVAARQNFPSSLYDCQLLFDSCASSLLTIVRLQFGIDINCIDNCCRHRCRCCREANNEIYNHDNNENRIIKEIRICCVTQILFVCFVAQSVSNSDDKLKKVKTTAKTATKSTTTRKSKKDTIVE